MTYEAEFAINACDFPSSNPATPVSRNGRKLLEFQDSADESVSWTTRLSPSYAGGGLDFEIAACAESATGGTAEFELSIEALGSQDLDSDGFAAAQSGTFTANATNGNLSIVTISFSDGAQMDSVPAGGLYRVRLLRDVSASTGSMVGDGLQLLIMNADEA